jgi:hypothetical protein
MRKSLVQETDDGQNYYVFIKQTINYNDNIKQNTTTAPTIVTTTKRRRIVTLE